MQKKLLTILNIVSGMACLVLAITLTFEFAFKMTTHLSDTLLMLHRGLFSYFIADIILRLILEGHRFKYLLTHPTDILIFAPFISNPFPFLPSVLITQIALLGILLGRVGHLTKLFKLLQFNPAQMLLLGFGTTILIGSLLLSLPFSTYSPDTFPFVDALFIATSAVCVTGLVTHHIADTFTLFGQIIILLLIQIGGLGIMSFSAILGLFISRKFTQKESSEFQSNYAAVNPDEALSIIKAIFKYTFFFEAIGAVILYTSWQDDFAIHSERIFNAIFHSVSAFCNAGFSLFQNSLIEYAEHPTTLLTIAFLIIIGGLGFPVILDLLNRHNKVSRTLKLQSKLSITVTATLFVFGTIVFLITEFHHGLADFSIQHKLLNAFFQSVTSRTAGFNSIPFDPLREASILLIVSLMFIGASPGSTGGGIKTSTFGVLIATLFSSLRSESKTHVFGRSITKDNSIRALSLITISIVMIFSFLFLLLLTESQSFKAILFEAVSAFGTVGLSLGITESLSNAGKAIIMILMFIGRVGPLTVTFAFTKQRPQKNYDYPDERIMIT